MHPLRKRRLLLILGLVVGIGAATTLALFALQENVNHFYSPSEVLAGSAPEGRSFRLGGVVLEGSSRRDGDTLKAHFVITDRFRELPVEYEGILPDLFKEGQSVIASGTLKGGVFVASEVLAKHDENYMPREVAEAIAKGKAQKAADGAAPTQEPRP
ncbi:MAG: cytochrome c maturation protein CcmE [Xanthomonadales bacterium]|nr:Cytochrome c-type biogenesis protein CcmE [Xanthomonadales bacterium]MCC6593444.1 cytochrome c maturation protein CcmE [Xanthomonadales bacterium]MCE7929785.1 cytochrome c maturation protein CcmE [Xanthomonadales bacterium PRO6]